MRERRRGRGRVKMAASGSERVAVELCKGINGLDKVVLRDPRGSTAEVLLFTIKTPTFDDFFFDLI